MAAYDGLSPTKAGETHRWVSLTLTHSASYEHPAMSDVASKPRPKTGLKTERPRLHKVILMRDCYTPRVFVLTVVKSKFRMNREQAYRVMINAQKRGACVFAV